MRISRVIFERELPKALDELDSIMGFTLIGYCRPQLGGITLLKSEKPHIVADRLLLLCAVEFGEHLMENIFREINDTTLHELIHHFSGIMMHEDLINQLTRLMVWEMQLL